MTKDTMSLSGSNEKRMSLCARIGIVCACAIGLQLGCDLPGNLDLDNDGIVDNLDNCPGIANPSQLDTDGDKIGDACDPDSGDQCPNDPNKLHPGICGCGVSDKDSDGDSAVDCQDGCPTDTNKTHPGKCGCHVAEGSCSGDEVVISASDENADNGEGKEMAFDGDVHTKWLAFADSAWIQVEFAGGTSKTIRAYSITSANDYPERDPRNWKLMGSNNGTDWATLDERPNDCFAERLESKTYQVDNNTAYKMVRLNIVSNKAPQSANATQIAEIAFLEQGNATIQPGADGGCDGNSHFENVLFIVVDDLTKTLGTYGHPSAQTPHIDKLANSGIQFRHAYSNYPVCNPSRSSFLTGMRPETTTIMDNATPLQSVIGNWVTLPALFKQNGFYTMSLGKVFHGSNEHNDPKAWDEIYDYGPTQLGKQGTGRNLTDGKLPWCSWMAAEGDDADQGDGRIANKAVQLIKTQRDKPFFLAVGFHKPHDPFIAPKKYFDLYPLEDCDPPTLPNGWERPNQHAIPSSSYNIFKQFSDQDKREFLRSYYACSSFMDAQVGKVIDALKDSGQYESTLIVLFGDHGYHLGEHNHWNKVTVYEKGTSAPFIIAGGSVAQGAKSDAMFEFIDIYPSLAELLGLDNIPGHLEGRSFADVVHNPASSHRSEVRAVVKRGSVLGKTVKTAKWRYTEWGNGRQAKELYDQIKDPLEYTNLADDPAYSDIVSQMKTLLHQSD